MKRIIIVFFLLTEVSFLARAISDYGYKGYFDFSLGVAYNINSIRLFSSNNMQLYGEISTTHGLVIEDWYVGVGIGYYSSFYDKESMYPIFVEGRYTFKDVKMTPFLETRVGIIYDPRWIQTVQKYGALGAGMKIYKGLHAGIRASIFSRPSRFFTANAAFFMSYSFGN